MAAVHLFRNSAVNYALVLSSLLTAYVNLLCSFGDSRERPATFMTTDKICTKLWRRRDGAPVRICDMTDFHLECAISCEDQPQPDAEATRVDLLEEAQRRSLSTL